VPRPPVNEHAVTQETRVGSRTRQVFAVSAIYALSAVICCLLAAHQQAHFVDLRVYRLGGDAVLHGQNLYRLRYMSLPFTYPPFAAVLCTGLAVLPWKSAAALLTGASCLALPVMLYFALRLAPVSGQLDRRARWLVAIAAATAAIWLEPVRTALGYGQIDVLIAICVLYDLSLPDQYKRKGIAIGLAAGLKLTPGIFVIYLLLTRRYRAAATAAVTFAVTVGIGAIARPASSARYWGGMFANPGHVAPVQDVENQSLLGALARAMHTPHVTWVWLPLAAIVAVAGLTLAARAGRAGDEAQGFSLCAVTGLLISPISWTHHWVIAVPALLLAGVAVYSGRARRTAAANATATIVIALITVIGWLRVARTAGSDWLYLSPASLAASGVYVIGGLAALALAASRRTGRTVRPGCDDQVRQRPTRRAPWLAGPSP
jgi:alpha-1,2-mannosyltransferase